ncbi:unnamed protein product, partial [Mesorhabditis spiculigera]
MGAGSSLVSRREILPAPEVVTKKGTVQGRRIHYKNGPVADIYLGIPYAKPPVGPLRFKRPVAPDGWHNTLSCRSYRRRAIQVIPAWEPLVSRLPATSEDCLYLNVFTPKFEAGKKYPVFFYIHGGALLMDSPARIPPEGICRQFVAQGVIVVTVCYRLGFLGFFSTGDEACPGNMGHLDQAEALKWTSENINLFGGDPSEITVGGQSAGAVSTDLLSISPLTRHLFNKKIVMGGSSFVFWATSRVKETVDFCKEKAMELGWQPKGNYASPVEEHQAMMEFLRSLPAKKFGCTFLHYKPLLKKLKMPQVAVLDGYFLPKPVERLRLEAPDMATICGVAEYEGLLFVAIKTLGLSKKSFQLLMSNLVHDQDEVQMKQTLDLLIETYKKDGIPEKLNLLYPPRRRYGIIGVRFPFHGATHASELPYLLRQQAFYSNTAFSKKEKILAALTSDYFSSFVKFGDPNRHGNAFHPQWPAISPTSRQMMCMRPNPATKPAEQFFGKRFTVAKEYGYIMKMWNDDAVEEAVEKVVEAVVEAAAEQPEAHAKHQPAPKQLAPLKSSRLPDVN